MSLRDSIINGLDTALKVGVPIAKKTIKTTATVAKTVSIEIAKSNANNKNLSPEAREKAKNFLQKYDK